MTSRGVWCLVVQMRTSRKAKGKEVRTPARVPYALHERVVKLSEFEMITVSKLYERAMSHCLDLPVEEWLRRKREEVA